MKKKLLLMSLIFSGLTCLHADQAADQLKQRVAVSLPWISGWCSEEKALNFVDLILDVKPQVCVEIGVFFGSSLFPVASALKFLGTGIVIGIDPYDRAESVKNYNAIEDKAHIDWWTSVDMDSVYNSCLSMLKNFQVGDHCIIIKDTAQKAISLINSIDILYLDGNHSETSNVLDVLLYLPKVSTGGYIWMNDALTLRSQAAIDILVNHCDIVKIIENGNCVLFKKR